MNISVLDAAPLSHDTSCLLYPVFAEAAATPDNEQFAALIQEAATEGFDFKPAETRVLQTKGILETPRVVLIGLGKRDGLTLTKWRHAVAKGARVARSLKKTEFSLALPALDFGPMETFHAATEAIHLGLHLFNDYKTDEDTRAITQVEAVTLLASQNDLAGAQEGAQSGHVAADATLRARGWVNLPSNLKSPQFLAEQAQQIAGRNGLRCEIWDEKRIQSERMGALYGVGMGSDHPPRFIILEHAPQGTEQDAPLILIGKGMSFDTGGYSLKPSTSMEDMKDDMAGAAAVLGAMSAVGELKPPMRIIALIPSAENMINGRAQRPGDIVTARNGKTIEVLNTDAEGRLILADALSYACELKPSKIIDLATLTGAIGIALGQEAAGLFSNDDELARQLTDAGEVVGERLWRFPMWDEYKSHIKGTISDVKNIGQERRAGSIAGAVFLENFVEEGTKWAHLDIAAVALIREDRPLSARGATGFGVRLLLNFLALTD